MKLKANKAFSWAHRGVEIEHFEKGQVIETEDADLIAVSIEEGWAAKVGKEAASDKAVAGAPENKASGQDAT